MSAPLKYCTRSGDQCKNRVARVRDHQQGCDRCHAGEWMWTKDTSLKWMGDAAESGLESARPKPLGSHLDLCHTKCAFVSSPVHTGQHPATPGGFVVASSHRFKRGMKSVRLPSNMIPCVEYIDLEWVVNTNRTLSVETPPSTICATAMHLTKLCTPAGRLCSHAVVPGTIGSMRGIV